VIAYRFGRDDLLRTRFAVSPLFELAASLRALRDPGGHSVHLPWAREARVRLAGLDYSLLDALHPSGPYAPDFVAPPPQTPLPVFEEELARVRATPPERVRIEVGWTFAGREVPAVARPLLDDPASALPGLADLMAEYWKRAIAPVWDLIRAVLEADIRQRSRHLAGGGALELFAGLHPDVRWHDGALIVDRRHEATVELAGRGLQLVPAVFGWPEVGAMFDPPWQPALIYPPRGVGDLWAPARREHRGARRARRPPPREHPRRARRRGHHDRAGAAAGGEPGRRVRAPRRAAPRRARAGAPRGPRGALLAHRRRRRAHSPSVFPRISFMISSVPPPIGPSRASRAARERSCASSWPMSASSP
jgi:hypothetical protein